MSALAKFLASLQAPVLVPSSEYDGLEYRWRFLVFRPALFKLDALLVVFVVFYVAYVFIGGGLNKSRAESLLNALRPVYEAQFSRPVDKNRLVEDGSSDFFVFSTGRRAVKSLLTVFTMTPRHDLLQLIYEFGWTQYDLKYNPEDRVQLDFLLDETTAAAVPGLVWAVVAKTELSSIKNNRWDLTLTKTTENAALPSYMSVMSEIADVTETLLKPAGSFSLIKLLSDPAIQPYFRSLSLTDQPSFRPPAPLKPDSRKKYVVLTLAVPPSSASSAVTPLVQGVFQFIDALSGHIPGGKSVLSTLRPETRTKLRKRREELDAELQADAERDAKEQEAEARENALAAKRQAEKDRIAALPAAEQQKALERERKKNMRKTQGKMVKK